MIEIRRYDKKDAAAVKAFLSTGPGQCEEDLNHIEDFYLKDGEFLVFLSEGEIIATGALRKISPEVAEITRIKIHPFFRDQDYEQIMLSRLEARAQYLGYRSLWFDPA